MSGALIVGGGQAGAQLAFSLRELGYSEAITILGAESHAPYQRPPLSKAFLAGTSDRDSLHFRKPAFYEKQNIDVVSGRRVVAGDVTANAGVVQLDDGSTRDFEHLALTVGGRPRELDIPGSDLTGVAYLRTIDDAVHLMGLLGNADSVVVVGGGFVGLEAAAMARARGKSVTVVEVAERLLARAVAPELSSFLADSHRRRGTSVRLGCPVTAIEGRDSRVRAVQLADGSVLPADVVIVGVGMTPRVELAQQLGLETAGGIVVDAYARTSSESVVAAGDCAVMPNPMTGSGLVRLESVQNAVDQAKVAAATIAGRPTPHVSIPWFWSNQGDLKIQMAGLSDGFDHVELRGSLADEAFSAFYYQGDRLVAVHAVNRPKDYMLGRKTLSQKMTIARADVGNVDAALVPIA